MQSEASAACYTQHGGGRALCTRLCPAAAVCTRCILRGGERRGEKRARGHSNGSSESILAMEIRGQEGGSRFSYGARLAGWPAGVGEVGAAPDSPAVLSGGTPPGPPVAAVPAKKPEKGLSADGAVDADAGEPGTAALLPPPVLLSGLLLAAVPPSAGRRGTPASASSLRRASPRRCLLGGSASPWGGLPAVPNWTPVVTTPAMPACLMACLQHVEAGGRETVFGGAGRWGGHGAEQRRPTCAPAALTQPHLATSSCPLSEVKRRSSGASGRPLSSHLEPAGKEVRGGRKGA